MPTIGYAIGQSLDPGHAEDLNGKSDSIPRRSVPLRGEPASLSVLRALGYDVGACAWSADPARASRDFVLAQSGRWLMQPDALLMMDAMPEETASFWLKTAAELRVPTFWACNGNVALPPASSGGAVLIQVCFAFHQQSAGAAQTPEAMAREYLVKSGAEGAIVFAAEKGAVAAFRGTHQLLHAPAIRGDSARAGLDCGEIHLAGFLSAFLLSPPAIRVERGLALGRLVAARHAGGLAPAGWSGLREYEKDLGESIEPISEITKMASTSTTILTAPRKLG
jgi:hypothetical protein